MVGTTRQKRTEERQEKDARRQARRREVMAREGKPLTHAVDRALVEAIAFHLRAGTIHADHLEQAVIPVGDMLKTARRILVKRQGYDRVHSDAAIKARVAARPEHSMLGHIPSIDSRTPLDIEAATRLPDGGRGDGRQLQ